MGDSILREKTFTDDEGKSNETCEEWVDDKFYIWLASWTISVLMVMVHHWIDHETKHSMESLRLHYQSQ